MLAAAVALLVARIGARLSGAAARWPPANNCWRVPADWLRLRTAERERNTRAPLCWRSTCARASKTRNPLPTHARHFFKPFFRSPTNSQPAGQANFHWAASSEDPSGPKDRQTDEQLET